MKTLGTKTALFALFGNCKMALRKLEIGDAILAYVDMKRTTKNMGFVRYIGSIDEFGMRQYVGIELIEPMPFGHNGTINGIQCM